MASKASKVTFGWASGSMHRSDPQKVGQRLAKLRKKHGALRPEIVLADARSPASPMHPEFEWDDAVAAERHRLTQAAAILRHCVTVDDHGVQCRAYLVVDGPEEESPNVYVSTMDQAMRDEGMRAQVLARALAELEAFRRKYRALSELAEVFRAIDKTSRRAPR